MTDENIQTVLLEEAEAEKALAEAAKARAEEKKIEAEINALEANRSDQKKIAEAKRKKIEAETRAIEEDSNRRNRTTEIEATRAEAEKTHAIAQQNLAEAEIERATAHSDLRKQRKDYLEKTENQIVEGKAGTGIRQFVRKTLIDIMGAVDEAAALAKTQELNEGFEGYLASASSIGFSATSERGANLVQFDLAVSVVEEKVDGQTLAGQLKVGVPSVFGAAASISADSSQSVGREQTNRIKFSVPISFAVQHASVEDE